MSELACHLCLGAADQFSPIDFMPVVGVLMLIMWMVMMVRKRRRRNAHQPTAREQLERLRQRERTRDDLNQIMVDIEQMAKRVSAQLDAKAVELDRLLDRAERQAAELRRLKGEPEPTAASYQVDEADPANQAAYDESQSVDAFEPASPSDSGRGSQRGLPGFGDRSTPASDEFQSDDPLTRSVYQLADAGLVATDIAGRLNEHVGKVELILALRQT